MLKIEQMFSFTIFLALNIQTQLYLQTEILCPYKAHSVHDNVILTSWERNFSKCFSKDTMFIFFFDANTIEKNDWDVVCNLGTAHRESETRKRYI